MANTQVSEGVYNTNESMFIGEFLCCIPLVWQYARSSQQGTVFSRIARIWEPRPAGYAPVGEEEEDETLCGWRMCWMWFPALFDSELREEPADLVCGTTLMNVGLILTPVSIYQMSRGALVLWVGVLSVMLPVVCAARCHVRSMPCRTVWQSRAERGRDGPARPHSPIRRRPGEGCPRRRLDPLCPNIHSYTICKLVPGRAD
jgi:hypothetical protein